jgi:hypothetical protein
MVDVNGVLKTFGWRRVRHPPAALGAKIVGGDITVRTVSNDSGTSTLAVGDENSRNALPRRNEHQVGGAHGPGAHRRRVPGQQRSGSRWQQRAAMRRPAKSK